jgi:two-component system sensor histidine kinase TctE
MVDRKPDNFEPLSEIGLQTEIQPLVSALNDFMARLDRQIARQRTFLENAAHQLRTPLAILKTQIGYGLKTGNLNDKNTALAAADGSINAMTRLTNQLLILARAEHDKQSVNLEPVDLSGVALTVISKAAPRASAAGIELVLDAEGQHRVMAQAMLVHEMFSNLVDNAILYAGQGAEVTVGVTSLGDEVVVKVQDNGPGIASQDRARAFERFQRGGGATGSGSGLGLSIVTEIAQLFGGNARIDESHEKGLAIIISMPSLR